MKYIHTSLNNPAYTVSIKRTAKGFEITEQRVAKDGTLFTHPIFFSIGIESCIQDWNNISVDKAVLVEKEANKAVISINEVKYTI